MTQTRWREGVATVRRWMGRAGLVALVLTVSSAAMAIGALTQGVHCPECDRLKLGDSIGWWRAFFNLKAGMLLVGTGLGVAAALLGTPRRFGLVALAGTAVALLFFFR